MFFYHVILKYSLIFYKQLHFESMARSWVIITTFKVKVSYKVAYNYNKLWSRDYAYINNLCSVFHYRTIVHLFENILKKFHCIRLNIEGYTAVPASIILLFSKMQQKPPNATKAPYAQSLILEGEYNFLVNFKIRNNFFFQIWLKYCIFKNNHQIFKSAPTDMIMK